MDKIRMARELVRLAKEIVSEDVASEDGKYEDFTGTINYKGSKGKVKEADFELKNGKIIWEVGIWKDGSWKDGVWYNGEWKNGMWNDGTWLNGRWEKGTWYKGTWVDGDWYEGKWKDSRNPHPDER